MTRYSIDFFRFRFSFRQTIRKNDSFIPADIPFISVRVQKTQKQWRKICGYFECVFATALSFGIDFQSKVFGIDQLISF